MMMYEGYTDRVRKVLQLADQEAKRFNHDCVEPEHFLLALLKEGSGVGANVLKSLAHDFGAIRPALEQRMRSRPDMVIMGKLPNTPAANRVLEYAEETRHLLSHRFLGTEHLLLGLLQSGGLAATVLNRLGVTADRAREEVLRLLSGETISALLSSRESPSVTLSPRVSRKVREACKLTGKKDPNMLVERLFDAYFALLGLLPPSPPQP